ncbi:MAG TPA: BON domain-containing protein [Bryobacteraceae bacterium]|nr:BON domain-containing protein [Bryobacteraceae bacterium]
MKRTFVSNAALLSQLLAVSAGLTLAGPLFGGQADQPPRTASTATQDKADRELTRQIRKAIVSDKSLSTLAHNVKILTRDGAVTLKGPVKSDDEKKALEDKASSVAGNGKVTSELTVGPNTSTKSKSE